MAKNQWVKEGNQYVFYDVNGKRAKLAPITDIVTGMGKDGYISNNPFRRGQMSHVEEAIAFFLKHGKMPERKDFKGSKPAEGGMKNIEADVRTWLSKNGINELDHMNFVHGTKEETPTYAAEPDTDPKTAAFNDYYKDIYSMQEDTGGREMYDRLSEVYTNQANADAQLADVQFQTQALQQAQTIKNITDQVRAERMARLRAGMSESQIANQDMTMMMANVNALNQNAQMMNQQRLQAQMGKGLAQDQAYMEYLNQANQRGQNAAAMYAADSGNAHWNTLQYMRNKPGTTYDQAHSYVTNTDPLKNK